MSARKKSKQIPFDTHQQPNTLSRLQAFIIDNEYYKQNSAALNLAVLQTSPDREQVEFPIRLDIPRLNWGICRRLVIPFMGDEYYDVRICVNMWLWRDETINLAHQSITEPISCLIPCPIREIRLWRNGQMIYSCCEFRVGDDGLGGPGVVLGSGKLISVMFEPISDIPMPIINRLRDRYDDYILDVEFKNQQELAITDDSEKDQAKTNSKITLRTATVNLLARVYSTDSRRDKFCV